MFYVDSLATCGPETELEGEVFEGPDRGIPVCSLETLSLEILRGSLEGATSSYISSRR